MAWLVMPRQIATPDGTPSGKWRLTALSNEDGGGPHGNPICTHDTPQEAEACKDCQEFVGKVTGFPPDLKPKKFDPWHKKTIAIDFDGVLHAYTSGWKGEDVIPDPAVPGMAEVCFQLILMGFEVIVMSSRARHLKGAHAIGDWLQANGFPLLPITAEKVPAEVYIDDRGFRFTGDASSILEFVKTGMTPWNKGAQE